MIIDSTHPVELRSISYTVPSASEPGKTYTVTVTDAAWTCTCEASQHPKTRGKCWHLKAAKAGLYTGKPHLVVRTLPAAPVAAPASRHDLYAA